MPMLPIMAHEVKTAILIHASPAKVWQVLTSFASYPAWNIYIKSLSGPVTVGHRITVCFESAEGKRLTVRVRVLAVDPGKELRWSGHLLLPGLVDGVHSFELQAHADGTTTLNQRETFRGLLVPLVRKMLDQNNTKAFADMNQKLKELAEAP